MIYGRKQFSPRNGRTARFIAAFGGGVRNSSKLAGKQMAMMGSPALPGAFVCSFPLHLNNAACSMMEIQNRESLCGFYGFHSNYRFLHKQTPTELLAQFSAPRVTGSAILPFSFPPLKPSVSVSSRNIDGRINVAFLRDSVYCCTLAPPSCNWNKAAKNDLLL